MTALVLAGVTSREFLQTGFSGIALGAQYALVALGFVIVFKATGVINFAQASFVVLGGYFTFNFSQTWELDFYLSLLLAMLAGAVVGILLEILVLRRMVGEQPFTVIMVTIGLLYIIDSLTQSVWGPDARNLGDPWGIRTVKAGDIALALKDLWTISLAGLVLFAFFLFFRYSNLGLAMRATAMDQEAALAQGISAGRVYRASWAFAGMVAALAGATLAAGSAALHPALGLIALVAFPAMILGGLDSPGGAVIGGLVIGIVQQLTALYQPVYVPWLGGNFNQVMPYIVMILILLVRPFGLFGTPEVRRV